MSSLIDEIASTYDDTPYMSYAFHQTAPEHLRAVAHLFGLDTPVPGRARVLELGCAAGGNLIPFAVRYPDAEVVGIDISSVQIAAGQRVIDAMKLENMRLIHGSITEIGEDLGQFDYVIGHGVYSWVPSDVREAVLRVCRERLTPRGVALISYNTYPGWKAKEIVRDAMLLRGGTRSTPEEKLSYARGMVNFLHDMSTEGSVLKRVMDDNIDTIRHGDTHYLMHEFMELCNAPCYFRDFLAAAQMHELAYLAEANVSLMFASNYGSRIAEPLLRECAGQQQVLEQLLDFLSNRTFRQTLLVHAARSNDVRYGLDHQRIASLHVAGSFYPTNAKQSHWRHAKHGDLDTASEVERQVVRALNRAWPSTVPVAQLLIREDATALSGDDCQVVLKLVEQMIISNQLRFRREPLVCASEPSNYPCAIAGVRALFNETLNHQAPIGLFNQWHENLPRLGAVEAALLPLLDGTRSIDALVKAMQDLAANGQLRFKHEDSFLESPEAIAIAAEDHTGRVLQWMAQTALLEQTA